MVKKAIFALAVILVLGVVYWLVSPLFIDKKVNEAPPEFSGTEASSDVMTVPMTGDENQPSAPLSQGQFEGLGAHNAKGTAQLIQTGSRNFIRFENDFEVTNGPDLYVYLGRGGQYDPNAELGTLKGNIGSQNYEVPENINLSDYDEVWVWCKQFSVGFGKARLM